MNDDKKTILFVILILIVLLFWTKTDSISFTNDDDDDPDVVSIDYRCSMLKEYKYVPEEVITECANRLKENKEKTI